MVLSLALRHFSRRNRISEARWDVMDVAYMDWSMLLATCRFSKVSSSPEGAILPPFDTMPICFEDGVHKGTEQARGLHCSDYSDGCSRLTFGS